MLAVGRGATRARVAQGSRAARLRQGAQAFKNRLFGIVKKPHPSYYSLMSDEARAAVHTSQRAEALRSSRFGGFGGGSRRASQYKLPETDFRRPVSSELQRPLLSPDDVVVEGPKVKRRAQLRRASDVAPGQPAYVRMDDIAEATADTISKPQWRFRPRNFQPGRFARNLRDAFRMEKNPFADFKQRTAAAPIVEAPANVSAVEAPVNVSRKRILTEDFHPNDYKSKRVKVDDFRRTRARKGRGRRRRGRGITMESHMYIPTGGTVGGKATEGTKLRETAMQLAPWVIMPGLTAPMSEIFSPIQTQQRVEREYALQNPQYSQYIGLEAGGWGWPVPQR